jgi:hypothetical protein
METARVPWRVVARYAGVKPSVVHTLLFGRDGRLQATLPRSAAVALVGVTPAELRRLRTDQVDAQETRRQFEALRDIGLSWADVARLVQVDADTVRRVGEGFQSECALLTQELARTVCAALSVHA